MNSYFVITFFFLAVSDKFMFMVICFSTVFYSIKEDIVQVRMSCHTES